MSDQLYVIGLSFGYHDSSVALLNVEGKLIEVHDEERFSRRKHDAHFPLHSLEYLVNKYNLSDQNIAKVCYYENPRLKLQRVARQVANSDLSLLKHNLPQIVRSWSQTKLEPQKLIAEHLNIPLQKVFTSEHHLSHLCSSLYTSGFQSGAFLTLDGVGELHTGTAGNFSFDENGHLTILTHKKILFPNSIGLFYTAVTEYLGFEVNEGEFKVMGLAPYGTPRHVELVRKFFVSTDGIDVKLNSKYFAFNSLAKTSITKDFIDLIGYPPRKPESPIQLRDHLAASTHGTAEADQERYFYADFAASCQKLVQDIILASIRPLRQYSNRLVLSGGVFYNSVANGLILREGLFDDIHIYPAAGDSGTSVGSAYAYFYKSNKPIYPKKLESIYVGRSFTKDQTMSFLRDHSIPYNHLSHYETLCQLVDSLTEKKVIALFHGSAEHGPRALGNRSIIASPLYHDMKDIVNAKIKYRELFRPFAPASTEEKADLYFDIPKSRDLYRYMLATCPVRSDYAPTLPATTHVDNSARLQIVSRDCNPFFYSLISEFGHRTSVYTLLNTSFNVRGEPIVDSLHDAISTFYATDIDVLYLNGILIEK